MKAPLPPNNTTANEVAKYGWEGESLSKHRQGEKCLETVAQRILWIVLSIQLRQANAATVFGVFF